MKSLILIALLLIASVSNAASVHETLLDSVSNNNLPRCTSSDHMLDIKTIDLYSHEFTNRGFYKNSEKLKVYVSVCTTILEPQEIAYGSAAIKLVDALTGKSTLAMRHVHSNENLHLFEVIVENIQDVDQFAFYVELVKERGNLHYYSNTSKPNQFFMYSK